MGNWYLEGSYSADICFCSSDCKNISCDRNKKGELYTRTQIYEWQLHSECDFSGKCKSYKKGV